MREICAVILLCASGAAAPANNLHLVVSSENAPPGGVVQVKVFAAPPAAVVSGEAKLSFDPAVFGNFVNVGFFSVAGDQAVAPKIQGTRIDVDFLLPSGGVGRVPDLPILTVTIPILPNAKPGTTAQVLLNTSATPWMDPAGNTYSVQSTPGTVTVGGGLWIGDVTPGGGVQPTGTAVRIDGGGFDPAATLSVDGVSVASVQFVSSQQMNFTLAAPAELTGKRVHVQNPDGSQVDYFASFRPVPADSATQQLLSSGEIIFPLRTWTNATCSLSGGSVAFQNTTSAPVSVTMNGSTGNAVSFTVPAAAILTDPGATSGTYTINASAPIQMVVYYLSSPTQGASGGVSSVTPVQAIPPPAPTQAGSSKPASRITTTAGASSFTFAVAQGSGPVVQYLDIGSDLGIGVLSASTDSGGAWLSGRVTGGTPSVLTLIVDPEGLAPGTYMGLITVSYPPIYGLPSQRYPVTLYVLASAPTLIVSPTSLSGTAAQYQTSAVIPMLGIAVSSEPAGAVYSVQTSGPIYAQIPTAPGVPLNFVTPDTLYVSFDPPVERPGTYNAKLTLTSGGQSTVVRVSINVTAGPLPPPVIGAVVNAGSLESGPVAPGEIVTLFGDLIGPPSEYGPALDASGNLMTTIANTTVTFDGIPAPILYASPSQINVIVPYTIPGAAVTNVQVEYLDAASAGISVPIAPSAPSIFTVAGNGAGQGAVLNQDNSVNGPENPAARGSVIQIFGTGEGMTVPAEVTGVINGGQAGIPVLPVSVAIDGVNATVQYAGSAPYAVSGLFQVNAIVPQSITPGPAVPIVLTVGRASSPGDVTITVE